MTQSAPRLPADFRRLALSNLAAQSAEQIALVAAPLVAVLTLGANEAEAGLLQIALTLPFLLLALPAGLLADRLPRAPLMATAEAVRALSLLALVVGVTTETIGFPALAVLGFVGASATVVYGVTAPALVPALVPATGMATANARIELARTIAFSAGPAVGGALVAWTGAGAAFASALGLSVAAAALLGRIREPVRLPAPHRHPLREAADGIAFVARHPLLRPVLLTQFIFNTAYFVILAMIVPYAVRNLGLSPAAIGLMFGLTGLGMVIGALAAPAVLRTASFGRVIGLGPIAGFLAASLLALTIWVPVAALAALSFFLFGIGPILWVISTTTLRQAVTPPAMLGRVSAMSVLAQGARPLGAALGTAIGATLGVEACLLLAVIGFAGQALLIWLSPVVRLDRQPVMGAQTAASA